MDLQDALRTVRTHWLSIVVITMLGGALGLGYSLAATTVYSATAQNFVAIGGAAGDSAVFGGSTFALQRVKSYIGVVDTDEVLEPVIAELGLDTTTQALARRVSASNPPQTVLLSVTATGSDPRETAAIANAAAVHFAEAVEAVETPAGGTSPIKVSQVLQAPVPTSPDSPRTRLNLALGLLVGFGVGIGQALLRDQFTTSVSDGQGLTEATGAPVLARIAQDGGTGAPLAALDRSSARGEGYRTLRTNLQYVDVDHPPRIVAVTSALPGEGKTTVACNLAVAVAMGGASVCLVEADLRRPAAAGRLGIDNVMGLTDVLVGAVPVDLALVAWHRGLLTVLPAGVAAPNPSELLGSRQMQSLLQALAERFDLVVLDAAPLLPVADGAVVAAISDGTLLVAKAGTTTRDHAARAAQALQHIGARLLGTVLNGVPASGQDRYGYYGGRGGYGSGSGSGSPAGSGSRSGRGSGPSGAQAGDRRPSTIDSTASLRDMFH